MSDMPYGCKGCRCWPDDVPAHGTADETWYPNAMCPHHGLLADYTPERKDTGVYTVLTGPCERHPGASTIAGMCAMCSRRPEDVLRPRDLSTPPDGPECPPGVHSMFDFCPGGCLNEAPDCDLAEFCQEPTTEEEHGVFATVRRGIARLVARAYWRY